MTTPQLNYRIYKEDNRHNLVSEGISRFQAEETARSNRANEALKAEGNAVSRYAAQLQASSAKYAADKNAENVRYTADSNAANTRYSADSSREASKYSADSNKAASKYSADKSFASSKYATDINNALQRDRLALETTIAKFNNAKTRSEINRINQDVARITQDMSVQLKDYALHAREQDNRDALRKANIAQGWINTVTGATNSLTKSFTNVTGGLKDVQEMTLGKAQDALRQLTNLLKEWSSD